MKALNTICNVAIIVGIVMLLGSVGALDCDTVTLTRGLWQIGISTVLLLGGLLGKELIYKH